MLGSRRQFQGNVDRLVTWVTVIYGIYTILYITNMPQRMGIYIDVASHRALFLTFLMIVTFITLPISKGAPRDRVPWYDILFLIVGIAGPLYVFFVYPEASETRYALDTFYPYEIVLGFTTILATLEITRRAVGGAFAILATLFMLHAAFGSYLPGALWAPQPTVSDFIHYLVFSTEGIFGMVIGVASTIIVVFIIFSQFLLLSAAGRFFIDFTTALLGHVRGGPAKIAVVSSSFFGSITGSASANVAATGSFTIPMMKNSGYTANFAGAVESVASSGGQLMPPIMGAVAFIMSELLGLPYWQIAVAALLPCILYYLAAFVAVDAEAVKYNLVGLPRSQCPSVIDTLKGGWTGIIPIITLVFLLGGLHFTADTSALYALAVLLLINMIPRKTRLKPAQFTGAFRGMGSGILAAGNACSTAGLMIGALMMTQSGLKLSNAIVEIAGGNLLILLILAAAVTYLLGMGMASVPAYLMVVILVAPALVKVGVPVLAAHLFVFYWIAIHFYTPPVCTAAYVAAGISGGDPWRTGFTAMRISVASYIVPFMFVYRPALLMMEGTPLDTIVVFIAGVVGVALMAWGLNGYMLSRKLVPTQRGLMMIGGILLMFPTLPVNFAGLALGGVAIFWETMRYRLTK